MRSLRTSVVAACLIAIAPAFVSAQNELSKKERDIVQRDIVLGFKPILKGVEYDVPANPAEVDACKIENVVNAQKKAIGVVLRDGQGKILRRVIDSDGNNKMDQWSYYQDGFEVYRESDLNKDGSPDECRWMNTAGTRIASVVKGKITGWKRISAEEASKVFVQGLVSADLGLIESVLATPDELNALGVPKVEVDQVAAAAAKRVEMIQALQKGLIGWNKATVWNRLDGLMPHLIPADAPTGVPQDMILYENAVIFAGPPNGQESPAKMAFLQVPEMIKVGENWKFVELPRAIDPTKPVMAAEGGIRSSIFRQQAGPEAGNAELEKALKDLAEFDNANAKVQVDGGKKDVAQFHVGRIPFLRTVVKGVANTDDRLTYEKQIVDSLAAAYQTGLYPKALDLLDAIVKDGGKVASYAAFRKISAVFAAKNDESGTNLMANQKTWMTDLKAFLDNYPKSEEAPDALIQLASASEFNAEEDEARKFYEKLTRDFTETDAGKKAAGAIKRLDLVGKPIDLRGPGIHGQPIDTARFKGKTLLVTFWASWADPVRRDLPELVKLYQKYHARDFEIVGVNLDNDRAELDAFLKESPLPWPQIFEPGGIEKSRYATEYGIIALPTMVLVDSSGKVVNRNIRTSAELERQLDKVMNVKQTGVALDR
jgi:thiol-disulfide isomerase/thioredoxin